MLFIIHTYTFLTCKYPLIFLYCANQLETTFLCTPHSLKYVNGWTFLKSLLTHPSIDQSSILSSTHPPFIALIAFCHSSQTVFKVINSIFYPSLEIHILNSLKYLFLIVYHIFSLLKAQILQGSLKGLSHSTFSMPPYQTEPYASICSKLWVAKVTSKCTC